MSQTPFPQFAKTTNADVIAVIEQNLADFDAFREKCADVTEKYTGKRSGGWLNGTWLRGARFSGIDVRNVPDLKALPGRWKKPDGFALRPYVNNPVAEEFKIEHNPAHTPGRGNLLWGNGYMGTGALFIHDGTAYSMFNFQAYLDHYTVNQGDKYGWEEIRASEYHLAADAYTDAQKIEAP